MTNGKSAASTCGVEEQTDEREIHRIVTIGIWSPIGNGKKQVVDKTRKNQALNASGRSRRS